MLYCNLRLAEIVEIPAERIIGASVGKLISASSSEEFDALFANALFLASTDTNLSAQTRDALRIAGAGHAGCVLTMTDITAGKVAQAALRRSEKLAAVGRLAATIAHEVNNPLAAAMNASIKSCAAQRTSLHARLAYAA